MSIFFWRDLGDELIKTGESIKAASQIIKDINKTLRDMPEVIETLVIALHETDQLLQSAGKNVNNVKIPAIDFDYINVVDVRVISNISLENQSVFGPMGDDLIKSGQQLHESEKQFNTLKDQIYNFSKSKGPLDDLTTVVLNPLAARLIGLGKRMR
jgi:hypothetical protein